MPPKSRPPACSPLAALHEHFLDGLARRDPVTGLDDRPQTIAFVAMVLSVPSSQARLLLDQARAEQALAAALEQTRPAPVEGTSRLAAYQIFAAHRALADDNRCHLTEGATAHDRYPGAVEAANGKGPLAVAVLDRRDRSRSLWRRRPRPVRGDIGAL